MKRANELNRTFLKEEIERAKKVKKCSISLVIKEIQIKMTLIFHFNTKWHSPRKQTTTNSGKKLGVGVLEGFNTLLVGM
jgi:hypothetical protein